MAKITSKAQINVGTELTIDEPGRTFTLNVAGNLVAKDGVTIQALYSKLIDLWTGASYQDSPFPMYAIDALSGQYQFGTDGATYNGWKPANDATRTYLRDGGWSEYSSAGVLNRQYVGIVGLGVVSAAAQLYYQRDAADAPSNFTYSDQVNEGIQVFGDPSNGNFDKRTYFKGFVREYAKKYDDSVLADTGKSATGAYIVNMLLGNEDDLDITDIDGNVSTILPYTKITVRYFPSAFLKDIDLVGTNRSLGIVIDAGTHSGVDGSMVIAGSTLTSAAAGIIGADYTGGTVVVHNGSNKGTYNISGTPSGTVVTITGTWPATQSSASFTIHPAAALNASLKQIYTKVQYLLRQNSNINSVATSVTGKTAGALLNFVGTDLKCGFFAPTNPAGGGSGVFVAGVAASDLNSITFYDNSYATRLFPFAAAGSLNFNANLTAGGTGYYRLFFTTLPGAGDDWGEAGAVTVNDKDGSPIAGTISAGSISFTFDYDGNVQGGRTAATDAAVTLVAGNAGTAKPVVATGTISRSKGISIGAVAEFDRVYA